MDNHKPTAWLNNCPIREYTADGVNVGRCWSWLIEGRCGRHGDVREALETYRQTGKLTDDPREVARRLSVLLG